MKRSSLTAGYYAALVLAAVIFGWAALTTWRSTAVRTDAGVIGLCNAAYWLFALYVLKKGELRTGGSVVSHTDEPKRFSTYFGILLFMGLVAAIAAASILLSKAARLK
jgi:hypothetical protein